MGENIVAYQQIRFFIRVGQTPGKPLAEKIHDGFDPLFSCLGRRSLCRFNAENRYPSFFEILQQITVV